MNFALSQRRTDRHPVGLFIVVGLHVLLAVALVSAKLATTPSHVEPPVVRPLDPTPPVHKEPTALPKVEQTLPRQQPLVIPTLPIVPDPVRDTVTGKTDDRLTRTDVDGPSRGDDDTVHQPALPRFTPRHASLNAGAAQCRPSYPAAAQRAGATGVSRLRFNVDAQGHIGGVQILQSSGATREHRLMDRAAAEALAQCPATPGTDEQGHPVGGTADVEYVWSLD